MTTYRARLMSYDTGGEGVYDFEERADLMSAKADDIVEAFMDYANRAIFSGDRVTYELNGAVKKADGVVVGMGELERQKHPGALPFTIIINRASLG